MGRSAGSKVFQDAVHGPMEFHELLVAIIDTPEFQRMRNIKQLSMTYFVYPAAAHNRFEHSLGVSFLAGQLLKAIEDNTEETVQEKTFLKDGKEAWKKLKLCVLVAGLCHDLGHGPFSHTWEEFIRKANYLKNRDEIFDHEEASGSILDIIAKNDIHGMFRKYEIGDEDIKIIKELIRGKKEEDTVTLDESMHFLYEIVANKKNDIDVDKWDYFLRDGLSFDLKITFDYRRLIKFCKVVNKPGGSTLAFREKEFISLQDMFRMRADLHLRAYQHRVSKNIELMLIDAMLKADQMFQFSKAHLTMETYTKLTDHILQEVMYKESDAADPQLEVAQDTLKRIMKRCLYQEIDEQPIRKKLKMEEISGLEDKLNKDLADHFGISQINVTNGAHARPLMGATFYDKKGKLLSGASLYDNEGEVMVGGRRYPNMKLSLPFGVLLLFCKMEDCVRERDHEHAKEHFKEHVKPLNGNN